MIDPFSRRAAHNRFSGSSHALVYAWRGDNAGPPTSAAQPLKVCPASCLPPGLLFCLCVSCPCPGTCCCLACPPLPTATVLPSCSPPCFVCLGVLTPVLKDLATAEAHFPGAKAMYSTFDSFVAELKQKGEESLPVITKDLADTWIWGAASDPLKVAKMRAFHRQRTACEAAGSAECDTATSHSPADSKVT